MGRRVSFDGSNIKDFPQHGVTVQRKPDRLYVMCRKFYLDAKGQRHEHRVYVGHVNQGAFYTSEESYKRRVIAQQAQAGITLSAHQIDFEPGIEKLSLHQVHMLQQFYQLNPEYVAKSPISVLALARRLQELATNAEHELWLKALESLSLDKLPDPNDLAVPSKESRPRKNAVPTAEDILLEAQIDIFNFTTSAEFKSWLALTPFEPHSLVLKLRPKSVLRPGEAKPQVGAEQSHAPQQGPNSAETESLPTESKVVASAAETKAERKKQPRVAEVEADGRARSKAQSGRRGKQGETGELVQGTADPMAKADNSTEQATPEQAEPQAKVASLEPVAAAPSVDHAQLVDAAAEAEVTAPVGAIADVTADAKSDAAADAHPERDLEAAQEIKVQAACAATAAAHKSVSLGVELQVDTLSGLNHVAERGARALGAEGPLTLGLWLNRPHPNGTLVALDEHSPAYYMARYRVYEADCNRWGFLTEPSLFAYCQHARFDFFLEQLSFDLEAFLIAQKLHMVQIESQERYFAPITLGTEIVVSVVPLKVQRSAICYYQEIRDRAGILRFAQKSRHACCEQHHGRQISIPEPILSAVIPYIPLTPVPEAL